MNSEERRAVALARLALSEYTIPNWATWIAQDRDGEWYAYESKPTYVNKVWLSVSRDVGRMDSLGYGVPPQDFKKEIYSL